MLALTSAGSPVMESDRWPYEEIWCCDFEYHGTDGDIATPVCMVATEVRSGKVIRLWQDELARCSKAPFDTGPDSLFVAFFASAEIGCFLALGWKLPERILDLFTEFRAITNGLPTTCGAGLLGALAHFGLPTMGSDKKHAMRDLILSGGPWSDAERATILDYCLADVEALQRLLTVMADKIAPNPVRLGQGLLRGRYMAAVSQMEHNGVPIDRTTLNLLLDKWDQIKAELIRGVDANFDVYDGSTFKMVRFEDWLTRNHIPWPRLPTGRLATGDSTFRQMAQAHPEIAPLHELRHTLSKMRLNNLQVGEDNRNRCLLSPFRAKTGRNQPSTTKFIFGPSRWLRGLIKPAKGYGIAYLDFSSQEIAIAAALSGDKALMLAYNTGDPYLAFAKQAGVAPPDATKISHKAVRDRCKAVVLGTNYGMGEQSIADRAGIHLVEARELLQQHRETYRTFWRWADRNVNIALAGGELTTVYGWPIRCGFGVKSNDKSLLNFPMQANGAEMLRLAACVSTEAGLKICAPIHDALLLEAPIEGLDDDIAQLKSIMIDASEKVLKTLSCRVDVDVVRYPDRYQDAGGIEMWDHVMGLIRKV